MPHTSHFLSDRCSIEALKDSLLFLPRVIKDKFGKVVSWFSLCQDASETFVKSGVTDLFFKKNGQGKFKKYTCSHGGAELWLKLCVFFRGGPN